MPRRAEGLSATAVRTRGPGRYADGNGLYLLVREPKSANDELIYVDRGGHASSGRQPLQRYWIFRYTRGTRISPKSGKLKPWVREVGLGSAAGRSAVSLADARIKAAELYRQVRDGLDPLEEREAEKARKAAEAAKATANAMTFATVMERCLAAHEGGWRNAKHRQQWYNTLKQYALPVIGKLPIGAVGTGEVMQILEPIWQAKPETATRLRGRLERILDYAKARGWRDDENPARWRGHLDQLLSARSKLRPVIHQPALPYTEAPAFMVELRQTKGIAALALEFTILNATRTGETIGARWSEIDLTARLWTVPPERTKTRKEHRVPLSSRAAAILGELAKLHPGNYGPDDFVFPGGHQRRPLSDMAMLKLLERMGHSDITVHGFRSTFRDWAAERTNYANHVVEAALAHTIGDKVEAAYRRSDLFEKRRRLMNDWAKYCVQPAGKGEVVTLHHKL